jgi:hypothetical protein
MLFVFSFPQTTTYLVLMCYSRALLSLFYMPLYKFLHNLQDILVHVANKIGLQKILFDYIH